MRSLMMAMTLISALFVANCGGNKQSNDGGGATPAQSMIPDKKPDDGKGIGEIKEVTLNNPLKPDMVEKGKAIYEMKCSACHKLTAQRVVGPGWAGVSKKRKPEWIMNMITNVEVMLAEDPAAQALLEECLTRMPNQNLSIGDARDVLEFIYANDAESAEGK